MEEAGEASDLPHSGTSPFTPGQQSKDKGWKVAKQQKREKAQYWKCIVAEHNTGLALWQLCQTSTNKGTGSLETIVQTGKQYLLVWLGIEFRNLKIMHIYVDIYIF